jgi:acyl-CoA synthetase (NDP forming)
MSKPPRGVYRRSDLERLFNPRSIAVFGVSPNPLSLGARTIDQLRHYAGKVYRVNPKYDRIGEEVCYPSIAALPEVPDCALVALPRDVVHPAIEECGQGGVGGAVVFASGYVETGKPHNIELQEKMTAVATGTGLRVVGPNCLGFVNLPARVIASFSRTDLIAEVPAKGGVGLVSQSGAMGFGLAQAARRGLPISHMLATGNACDVNIADGIAYLAEDPACAAIACLFEGLANPWQLVEAGEIAMAQDKPVIVYKLGTGEEGAAAAMSHTGSLAGADAAWRAACHRAGIIMVDNVEAMLETAAFFAKSPRRPSSRGVAVLASSGGAAIACADMAERHGVSLPQPRPEVKQILEAHVPEYGSARNPCDVTTALQNDPKLLPACLEAMLGDTMYGTLVFPQAALRKDSLERRNSMAAVAERTGKLICLPFVGGWLGGPGTVEAEANPHFAWFYEINRCFAAIAAWHWRAQKREQFEQEGLRKLTRLSPPEAKDKAAKRITASANITLTEREAKDVLALYGVPVVGEKLVQSATEAVEAAQSLGLPVVMKLESPDIPHKTEAGVIRLNLKTADEVKPAYEAVMANAKQYKADAKINGVLVQPMVGAGAEIMVGGKVDPLFGPLIVAGLGGVLVELMKDTALDLAPIGQGEAHALLGQLKGQAMLTGFRGSQPVDQDRLAEVIVRLSEFLDDQRELITELDVNPLICSGSRILAVDALIVRKL